MSHEPSDIFLTITWVCMRLDGSACSECLPVVTFDFDPPEHGPRPGPRLALWCSGGLPACPGAESTSRDPRPEEKKGRCAKETNCLKQYKVPLRDVYDVKSQGWRKLMKGETKVTQKCSKLIYTGGNVVKEAAGGLLLTIIRFQHHLV